MIQRKWIVIIVSAPLLLKDVNSLHSNRETEALELGSGCRGFLRLAANNFLLPIPSRQMSSMLPGGSWATRPGMNWKEVLIAVACSTSQPWTNKIMLSALQWVGVGKGAGCRGGNGRTLGKANAPTGRFEFECDCLSLVAHLYWGCVLVGVAGWIQRLEN